MNPILGVFFHWLGGFASGSFYVPFRGVKRWSWETAWLVAGVFSWLIAPWFFALLNTTDAVTVLRETPGEVWFYAYLFGALWGFGGLTFGLTMRYLGMSLGMAVALGYCTVFGTLIPPLFKGEFMKKLIEPENGRWVLAGLVVCMLGIVITAMAGRTKEGEMDAEQKRKTVKEFNFKRGILVATFSGIMSACFAFGLSAGDKIREITYKVDLVNSAAAEGKTVERTTEPDAAEVETLLESLAGLRLFAEGENPSLAGVLGMLEKPLALKLAGGENPTAGQQAEIATAEAAARAALEALEESGGPLADRLLALQARLAASGSFGIIDNLASLSEKETALNIEDSGADLAAIHAKHSLWTGLPVLIVVLLGGFTTNFVWCVILNVRNRSGYEYLAAEQRETAPDVGDERRIPRLRNYLFAAMAGVTWYFQFFFYSMGETQMGEYKFSSWTLHMASIIIFSSLWGLFLGEWKGSSRKAKTLLFVGLGVLILSTIVIGYGNYIGGQGGH